MARDRAEGLLATFGDPRRLARAGSRELSGRGGLTPTAATRLAAAFELGRRLRAGAATRRRRFSGGREVFDYLALELGDLEQEVFEILLLDARNGLIRRERVSQGTLTGSLVHPREVFRSAVREAAAAIVLVHNHPSGDPSPSAEDLEVTERLCAVGELLGIRVLDHLIVGAGDYVSFAERGLIGPGRLGQVAEGSAPRRSRRC